MPLLEWREAYSMGMPGVDYEHRHLINIINELAGKLEAGADPAETSRYLGDICAAIEAHFALEERTMLEAGYDEYADHKADHENLIEDLHELMDLVATGPVADWRPALAERLEAWFGVHFRTKDPRFHKFLERRGIAHH